MRLAESNSRQNNDNIQKLIDESAFFEIENDNDDHEGEGGYEEYFEEVEIPKHNDNFSSFGIDQFSETSFTILVSSALIIDLIFASNVKILISVLYNKQCRESSNLKLNPIQFYHMIEEANSELRKFFF
uniref:Uncharacterized protein n=1 Tax=Rhizophagus irregularis (strain DAOM 181602 / DAOM 197198 / MUCL 43194) TaxID=747089 RepID=U9UUE6_RHIID